MLTSTPATRDVWAERLAKFATPEIKRLTGQQIPAYKIIVSDEALLGQICLGFCDDMRDGSSKIVIAAYLKSARAVAAVIVHELLHAAMPDAQHDWTYRATAAKLGLKIASEGYQTETREFWAWIDPLLERMPPYPDPTITAPIPPKPLPLGSIHAIGLCAASALTYTLPLHFGLSRAMEVGPSLLVAFFTWGTFVLLGWPLGFGLTDSALAPRPQRRHALQWAICLAPLCVFALAWLLLSPGSGLSNELVSYQSRKLSSLLCNADGTAPWSGRICYQDLKGIVSTPAQLASEAAFLAASLAYVFISYPLAWRLWQSRPFSRYYRIGNFEAPTPPFLLQHRQRPGPWGYKFNRASPSGLGSVMKSLELGARFERAKLGRLPGDPDDYAYRCELVPESGFLVEDRGSIGLYACEILGPNGAEQLAIARRFELSRPHRVRLIKAKLAPWLQQATPALPSIISGAKFANPHQ